MTQARLTISEVADLLHITPKMIRHYHEIGVLPEPERGENGYRLYSGADLRKIQTIRELQSYGLSLKQIRFVLDADEPDLQLRAFLVQRDRELTEEMHQIQQQQNRVRAFLDGQTQQPSSRTPSYVILHSVIRPVSHSLADVLMEVETAVLTEIDLLPHRESYEQFWEEVGSQFAQELQPHEHSFILWLERYLALAGMSHDDRQAQAWLSELRFSRAAPLLVKALDLPPSNALSEQEQLQIRNLIPLLLYEQATPLQKAFIAALKQGSLR